MTPTPDPLTAADALAQSGFTEYRKKLLTSISDIRFPPGTVYQTPEGLRTDDEETRCAFDVQGGIYPIRESVFQASYEVATQPAPAPDVREAALFVLRDWFECQCDEAWTAHDLHAPHCYADEIDKTAEAIALRVTGVWTR